MPEKDLNPFKEDFSKAEAMSVSNLEIQPGQEGMGKQVPPIKRANAGDAPKDDMKGGKAQGYSSQKIRAFLVMLAKACMRHQIRESARKDFHEHINKIKANAASPNSYPKANLEGDLEELKRKVGHLIMVEKNADSAHHSKFAKEKIALLESKLDRLMQGKLERERRFEELEKRIDLKLDAEKHAVTELERKLLFLQKRLIEHKLKRGSPKNKKDFESIKQQIEKTKSALDIIKARKANKPSEQAA